MINSRNLIYTNILDLTETREDNSSNQAAGLTQMSLDEATGYFVSGKLYLNRAYLLNPTYGYSYQRIVNTAEHELGHVIAPKYKRALKEKKIEAIRKWAKEAPADEK
ncbi:zinc metalloprotease [Limosilactobacillus fermentum]|uniref:hypothetical protein n=1 Tax=Limosilactobacillus fermentum TaxID=1613 RepID=UPI000B454DB4